MAEHDDWLDGIELDGPADTPLRKRKQDYPVDILLPRALLESVIGMDGILEISSREAFCLVVRAPSIEWVEPLQKMLKKMCEWDFWHVQTSSKRSRQDDVTGAQIVSALTGGGRVVGISQQPEQLLPAVMMAGADMTIDLRQPNARVIGAVIKAVTGEAPEPVDDRIVAGLEFEEIAGCIRHGSTPDDCIRRLRQAVASKIQRGTIDKSVPHVRDLHGYGEAQTWGLNLIEDLEAWRRGEIDFDDIDRNAVLVSPPGLGKTTFATSLAKSAGVPLVATSVGQWFANSPGYLDSIIKQIDEVFSRARAMAPAVLFLDELDAVPNRATISNRGADWWLPVITHLLITLDGAVSSSTTNLIVIGATNHGDKIDAALVRPGRLSKIITIDEPNAKALAGIFRQHLGTDLEEADLAGVATLALGASGAKVVAWVKSARRTARQGKRAMVMADLVDAVAPKSHDAIEFLRRAAVHEAGHAVSAYLLKVGIVEAVSIVGGDTTAGFTLIGDFSGFVVRDDIERFTVKTLAGRAAEEILLGEPSVGAGGSPSSDLAKATMNIGSLHLSSGMGEDLIFSADRDSIPTVLSRSPRHAKIVDAHLRELYDQARDLMKANIGLVNAVADALIEHRVLDRRAFAKVVESHSTSLPALAKEKPHG